MLYLTVLLLTPFWQQLVSFVIRRTQQSPQTAPLLDYHRLASIEVVRRVGPVLLSPLGTPRSAPPPLVMVSHQSAVFTRRWRRRTPPFFVYLAFGIPSLCAYFITANVSLLSSVCAYFSPRCSKELMMMKRGERYEHHEYDNKNVNKHMWVQWRVTATHPKILGFLFSVNTQ
ncbi:hypothetical protein DdX_13380 [Ditylenchus destructor]|uniref:Uncharacterized protein n=1 Tax=Ditylenchus destructor TaxID=166010 RepID=A0AAD4MTY2_9BILA|nr:hypothetical protein DdX_13380 [Ditylenchus destructor]